MTDAVIVRQEPVVTTVRLPQTQVVAVRAPGPQGAPGTPGNQGAAVDRFAPYHTTLLEELPGGLTYVLGTHDADAARWLMRRIIETTTTTVIDYAGPVNNSAVTTATAWADRATLVYGAAAAA